MAEDPWANRIPLNPSLTETKNSASMNQPSEGTTGVSESVEVTAIPNVGASEDAPSNKPPDWSAK